MDGTDGWPSQMCVTTSITRDYLTTNFFLTVW